MDTLEKYGHSFQTKSITALITDKKFLDTLAEIVSPVHFESDTDKWIVGEIIDYHKVYRKPPDLDVFKVKVSVLENVALKTNVILQLKVIFTQLGDTDLNFIKDEFTSFCINQNLKQVILKSVDLLNAGSYDKIKVLVDAAMKAGVNIDLGHDYLKDFDERAKDEDRIVIPTGWDSIDVLMNGGLGPGELGVVVAPSGVGKTWLLTCIGANAVKQGLNVVHYSMELSEYYVGARYDTVFTHIPSSDLKEKNAIVKDKVERLKGNLLIKYFPPKGVTVNKIQHHIEQLTSNGQKPDIIILDYADLVLPNAGAGDSTYAEQGGVYIELRGMGGELQIPIWTASQTNRCLSLDTLVDTKHGKVEIGNIKENDEVLTHSGFKTVTHVFERETQPVYEIKLKSGKTIKSSDRHMFPTKYGKCKSINTGLKVGDKLFTKKVSKTT